MAPRNVDDIYPLTPMQRLMLLHSVANPDSVALENEVTYEIDGPLDAPAFREALRELVARHPALRTAILWEGLDQPLNVVRTSVDSSMTEVDLSDGSLRSREAQIDEILRRHRVRRPNLNRPPLMHCTLARLGPERHVLVWGAHHLIMDRWSFDILMEELQALYRGLVSGRPADLPEPGRFRDYIAWLKRRDPGDAESFWKDHLAGVVRSTPWVEAHVPDRDHGRARTTRHLDADEAKGVEARAQRWKLTPATLILGAMGLFLARRSQTPDPVVGLTVSGRPPDLHGVERTVGSFVNNVPLRFRLRRDEGVADWLRELQWTQARRQLHEHVSLADLHDLAGISAGDTLFDGLVVLNLLQAEGVNWGDLAVRPVRASLDAAYPWIMEVSRKGAGLRLTLAHDAGFDGADGMLDEFAAALGKLVQASPDALVRDLQGPPPAPPESPPLRSRVGQPEMVARAARQEEGPFLAQELLTVWQDVLGRPSVGMDDDFFRLGGTSLQAAQIFARVERVTGQALPLATLLRARSVRALLGALGEPLEFTGPLVPIRSRGSLAPVVAVPGIGGNVVGLYPLARALGVMRPFYGLRSRGLDGREDPLTTIEEIGEDYADQIAVLAADGIHLVGACWGAAVAVEVARRLQSAGTPCLSLSLLDPPPLIRLDTVAKTNVARDIVRDRLSGYWRAFRGADWPTRMKMLADKGKVAARLARSGGASESLASEVNARRVRAANTRAVERYRPQTLSAASMIFFSEGHWMGPDDPRLEWLEILDPSPRVVRIPGSDSGDAITAHAASFARELESWVHGGESVST